VLAGDSGGGGSSAGSFVPTAGAGSGAGTGLVEVAQASEKQNTPISRSVATSRLRVRFI
jgi:hypothetical protein